MSSQSKNKIKWKKGTHSIRNSSLASCPASSPHSAYANAGSYDDVSEPALLVPGLRAPGLARTSLRQEWRRQSELDRIFSYG